MLVANHFWPQHDQAGYKHSWLYSLIASLVMSCFRPHHYLMLISCQAPDLVVALLAVNLSQLLWWQTIPDLDNMSVTIMICLWLCRNLSCWVVACPLPCHGVIGVVIQSSYQRCVTGRKLLLDTDVSLPVANHSALAVLCLGSPPSQTDSSSCLSPLSPGYSSCWWPSLWPL